MGRAPSQNLFEYHWTTKPKTLVDAAYVRGHNLRVDAAARYVRSGERHLDLGCGAGVLGQLVAPRFRETHGLDVSSRAVEAAVQRGVRALVWDLNRVPLPFDGGRFDVVTALSVLQYILDPGRLLREVTRVLRPGGRALISFPNMRTLGKLYRLGIRGRFPRVSEDPGYDGGTIRYYCRQDVADLMRDVGLRPVRTAGAFTRPRWLEGGLDWIPLLGRMLHEFLSSEILLIGRRIA